MTRKDKLMALDPGAAGPRSIPTCRPTSPSARRSWASCPTCSRAYAFDNAKLRAFILMADDLMLGDSGLSKLEREMIAVAVSAVNHCHYCLTSHGAAAAPARRGPRARRADRPELPRRRPGRRARRRCSTSAVKLTEAPDKIEEADREGCARPASAIATSGTSPPSPASTTCRTGMAAAADMQPNREYHYMVRERAEPSAASLAPAAQRRGRASGRAAIGAAAPPSARAATSPITRARP